MISISPLYDGSRPYRGIAAALVWMLASGPLVAPAQQLNTALPKPPEPIALFRMLPGLAKAAQVHESIYQATGVSNTSMVVTPEGNVVIDTSLAPLAPFHKKSLQAANGGPVKYIILTHAHADHTGGIPVWMERDTQVIAQKNCYELISYQNRLDRFFAQRNAAQFDMPALSESPLASMGTAWEANIVFDKRHEFQLGGITFQLHHTPGETSDHVSIWIPQFKAAFVGDNYYRSFPNLYSLRGTRPRWALEYVESLNTVLSWKPELLLCGHGPALAGHEQITRELTRYRDAIQYVHDATVHGMNEGKDVHTLMRDIKLPPELQLDETYGKVSWSVRGIYEGYVGWFDGNPASMYSTPPAGAYPEVVAMAGGPDAVARRAADLVRDGYLVEGLHLADIALAADEGHVPALETRLAALTALEAQSTNAVERGWLRHGMRTTKKRLSAE
jgi:alkyl sulfatase BDS1-like metallo-beta-lactamase superfamily hydrolase